MDRTVTVQVYTAKTILIYRSVILLCSLQANIAEIILLILMDRTVTLQVSTAVIVLMDRTVTLQVNTARLF